MEPVLTDGYQFTEVESAAPSKTYACAVCRDIGLLEHDNGTPFPDYVKCVCRKEKDRQEQIERFMGQSGMSDVLRKYTFRTFEARGEGAKSPAVARRYAFDLATGKTDRPWLFLYGTYGSGKTHLAIAVVNYWITQRLESAIFGTVPDLIDRLRDGYRDGTYGEMLRTLQTVSLLVLDDFGIGRSNADSNEYRLLFQIINARSMHKLFTIITSNLLPDDLEPRIRSRIMDANLCQRVEIAGDDARLYG